MMRHTVRDMTGTTRAAAATPADADAAARGLAAATGEPMTVHDADGALTARAAPTHLACRWALAFAKSGVALAWSDDRASLAARAQEAADAAGTDLILIDRAGVEPLQRVPMRSPEELAAVAAAEAARVADEAALAELEARTRAEAEAAAVQQEAALADAAAARLAIEDETARGARERGEARAEDEIDPAEEDEDAENVSAAVDDAAIHKPHRGRSGRFEK